MDRDLGRILTRASFDRKRDQLPALAGIAGRWGELSNDTYLAGIWLSHLPQGLLWSNACPEKPRPKSYSAPSWSWTSLDNFFQELPADEAFKLLSHQIELEFPDLPYGKVKDGSITIRGKVIPMLWNLNDKSLRAPDADHGYLHPDFVGVSLDVWEGYNEDNEDNEDNECEQQDFEEVWLLQLVLFDDISRKGPAGLVLKKDESNKCRRLGIYFYDQRGGFIRFVDEVSLHQENWYFYEAMIEEQRKSLTRIIEPTTLIIL
ncbi:hypothetical protein GJ744_012436 [Endocarpon pusillum]|uniref:Uncharacterized protein n=1 Tax=Endocarpon pusillum TaxID=364733 RepID=A0A8H7E429_9EURO|nr:hypothetical protein GJ744_012436 [Endocarpon pusillum]